MNQKKLIFFGAIFALLFAGWQGWVWFEKSRESRMVGGQAGDPFANLVIPAKYTADPATKQVIEGKIAATKAMYAEKPDIWETWIAIGNLKALLEDFHGAIAAYTEANARQEHNILGFRNIAEMYRQHLRDYKKAEEYYRLALKSQLDDGSLYISLAFIQYKHLGKPEAAEQTYLAGLSATKDTRDIMTALIQFYKDTGNTEKYAENVRALLAQYPDNMSYREAYAREFAAMGLTL